MNALTRMLSLMQGLLRQPRLLHIRRNHALEHATIHILSQKFPHRPFIGRSDSRGFFIFGEVSTEDLRAAVQEALARLRIGNSRLAIHPNCGTNLVTAGLLGGAASYLTLSSEQDDAWRGRLERLPLLMLATTLALLVAQPLGRAAQAHLTTEADPGPMMITSIRRMRAGSRIFHRVLTSS